MSEERFSLARSTAEKASLFLLSHESLRTSVSAKADNDFVTTADRETEKLIRDEIKKNFPGDYIYGEEFGGKEAGERWIIDPIDGTVNYMAGFPFYTVSIGYFDSEGPLFGVVSVPRQKEQYYAYKGKGAYMNGERIQTDETSPIERTLALLVPPHRVKRRLNSYMEKMKKFYYQFTDARSIGSAALSICYVASGRAGAYYEEMLKVYDTAAARMILEEAGGVYREEEVADGYINVTAANKKAFKEVDRIIHG